jgi:hypothetical protein
MNFERNISPKVTMGIGLEADSVPVEKIYGRIYLKWNIKNYYQSEVFNLKQRWFISKKWILPLLGGYQIKVWKLRLLFRAKVENGDIEKAFKVVFPWLFILGKTKKIRRHRPRTIINLSAKWDISTERYHDEISRVSFTITTNDLKRVEDISERNKRDAEIKGAIHRGKIYPIKHGNKELI